MTELAGARTVDDVINSSWNRETIVAMTKQYKISLNKAEKIYRDVRFYTHGIACQICCGSIVLRKNEICQLIENMIEKLVPKGGR